MFSNVPWSPKCCPTVLWLCFVVWSCFVVWPCIHETNERLRFVAVTFPDDKQLSLQTLLSVYRANELRVVNKHPLTLP